MRRKSLALAILAAASGAALLPACSNRARLTAEAPAEILSVSVERNRTRSRRANGRSQTRTETETDVRYRFDAGGRTLSATTSKDGDQTGTYRAGMRAKVCYNPSKPEESEVFTPDHRCGG